MENLSQADKVLVVSNFIKHRQGGKLRKGRINDIARKATAQTIKKLMKSLTSKQLKKVHKLVAGNGLKLAGQQGKGLKLAGERSHLGSGLKIPKHILKIAHSNPRKIIAAVKAIDKHGDRVLEMTKSKILGRGESVLLKWMMANPKLIPRLVKVSASNILKGKGGGRFQPANVTGSINPAGSGLGCGCRASKKRKPM
jgi:hypothetical protein